MFAILKVLSYISQGNKRKYTRKGCTCKDLERGEIKFRESPSCQRSILLISGQDRSMSKRWVDIVCILRCLLFVVGHKGLDSEVV